MIGKIFNGAYLKRLDNIDQWQERDVFTKETVASHSYKVTIFCRILLQEVFNSEKTGWSKKVSEFALQCLSHAMFHDWDEALILRDISHETKYNQFNGKEIRDALDRLSSHLAKSEFMDGSDAGRMIYKSVCAVETPGVHTFVKVCDWLALAFFLKREKSLGNNNFSQQIETVNKGLKESMDACVLYLQTEFKFECPNLNIFSKLLQEASI